MSTPTDGLTPLATDYLDLDSLFSAEELELRDRVRAFVEQRIRPNIDLLPPGSIRIDSVEIDGKPYDQFDAVALTVKLPEADHAVKVKVRMVPTSGQ